MGVVPRRLLCGRGWRRAAAMGRDKGMSPEIGLNHPVILGFVFVGDALNDALNPRIRER